MKKGLTLIELLVAITILSLIMGAIVGIFTAVVKGQMRALASQQLLDQTSYVIEYMSRALRMARKDNSFGNCTGISYSNYTTTTNGIIFLNYQNKCQEFWATSSKLQERESSDHTSGNFGSWVDLTSDKLEVVSFNVNLQGEGDGFQPRVTIFLDIKGKRAGLKAGEQPEVKVQNTVSQRNLDTID